MESQPLDGWVCDALPSLNRPLTPRKVGTMTKRNHLALKPCLTATIVSLSVIAVSCSGKTNFAGPAKPGEAAAGGKPNSGESSSPGTSATPGASASAPAPAATTKVDTPPTTAPTVTLSTPTTDIKNAASIQVTATFNMPVTGLTADKIIVTNGTITNLVGDGSVYTFTLTPNSPGPFTVFIPGNAATGSNGKGNSESPPISETQSIAEINMTIPLTTSSTQNAVWVVTSDGNGAKIQLDPANNYPMTTFTGTGASSGHRTFVSPYGLFIGTTEGGATGGKIYFVTNKLANGDAAVMSINLKDSNVANPPIAAGSRICVTRFTSNNVEYIGAAYTAANGKRRFYKAPIDPTKPGYVDTSRGSSLNAGTGLGEWGYSCYTDQTRNYFWSKNDSTRGNISGINLNTNLPISVTLAPNYYIAPTNNKFTMAGPDGINFDLAASGQSYALAGTVDGNLLAGTGATPYTMAHEPISGTVFVSSSNTSSIYVMSSKCFSTTGICSGVDQSTSAAVATFDPSHVGYIGPMSSLNDGRILGLERSTSKSNVFLMSLVDPKDLTKGLNITKIKELTGDAYIYSDFTGSMDLAKGQVQTFDLTQATGFTPDITFKTAALTWDAVPGTAPAWNGLILSVACFKKGATGVTAAALTNVAASGTEFDISKAPGCSGAFDQVQISVQPAAANTLVFSKTVDFKFHGKQ